MSLKSDWDAAAALEQIRAFASLPGALLPVLRSLQDRLGYVDSRAIPLVAEELNISRAEVVGGLNFYHELRKSPPGRHVLKVCRAEACQARGGESLLEYISVSLGAGPGETTPDGEYTIESVYCLGNCPMSPAAMLDGTLHGRLDVAAVDQLLGIDEE